MDPVNPAESGANHSPNLSAAKRKLLEKYLRGEMTTEAVPGRAISLLPERTHNHEIVPPWTNKRELSLAQERLWFLDQLMPGSAVFNVPMAVRIHVGLNLAALKRSIAEVVRRHEVLRTTFAQVDGQPVANVAPAIDVDLPLIDLSSHPKAKREAKVRALISAETRRAFNLARGPLMRAALLRLSETEHILLVIMHHIVSDGWSMVLFFQELSQIYEAFSSEERSRLAELPIQYADYAAWQRDWLKGNVQERQLAYWKEKLSGELPVLDLPADRPRPVEQTYNGARKWLVLTESQTEAFAALGRSEGATLFMALLAAFKVLLHRYSGQEDIIVGAPISSRPLVESESLIGFFLNNLALRTDLSGNPSFRELLARVRLTVLEAFANQDVPFEKLIEELRPERDLGRTPIFQVYFNLLNFTEEICLPGAAETISFIESWALSEENFSKFDLTFYAGVHQRRLKLALVYNVDLFDGAFIDQMLEHFETLLVEVAANPDQAVAELTLNANRNQFPTELRPVNGFVEFKSEEIEQSIAQRFASQVKKYPSRLAVSTDEQEWTYAELNDLADRVAQAVIDLELDDEAKVALLFEPGAPMIAAMLGALKAGKAYVPLDPMSPNQRLRAIIEHSEATALLTDNANFGPARRLANAKVQLLNVERINPAIGRHSFPCVNPDKLAYILYTSGSTGEPKGVMQNHRNVLHYLRVYTNNLHINSEDRLTLLSSYCFDASVMDIYGALLNGATLYPIDIRKSGLAGLREQLSSKRITIYHSTPTVYRYFVDTLADAAEFPQLRLVVLGGEEVKRRDVELYRKYFSDECTFVNGLGPTEATVSLQNFINKETRISSESVPVGFPVEDTEILLLNEAGNPVEMHGEIAIKSPHVALGYWRNPEATRAAFVCAGRQSERVYRTGDLGRRLPDGSIRFAGRKDFQVKIRGFRVELGEIESVLSQHPQIRESVVILRENAAGEKLLAAYVVARSKRSPGDDQLRSFLKAKLPEYMLPATFVSLAALPVTASGKVNRLALPAPVELDHKPAAALSLPQTTLEKLLLPIWNDVLGVTVGVHDNFFECGGHSLLAVRLFAEIEKRLGRRRPLATLFRAPTVAQLAAILEEDWTEAWSSLVPIQTAGDLPPFFCVHGLGGNVLEFYDLARHLGRGQPFYALQSRGLDGKQPLHNSIKEMAADYLREIRRRQPEGPYFIGGRSLGGTIAFEMACQLRAQDEEVGLLALLDTYPSGYLKLLPAVAVPKTGFGRAANRIERHFRNLRRLGFFEKISYLIDKARYAPRKIRSAVWRRIYSLYRDPHRTMPRALRSIEEFNSIAVREYAPQFYDGKVTLFWACSDLRAYDLVAGWRVLAATTEVHEIPGTHLDIIKEPHVGEVARKLGESLARAQGRHLRLEDRAADESLLNDVSAWDEPMQKAS